MNGTQSTDEPVKFLIYGRTGWIGGLVGELLEQQGIAYEYGSSRLEDRRGILEDIQRVRGEMNSRVAVDRNRERVVDRTRTG